ncbi:MAG: chemotaxis protein [Zetaproteobacteria bacterium]|nr:chemotaxis protein [Zetaproteobacteria bacterium]
MKSVEHLLESANCVSSLTNNKILQIHGIMKRSHMLALNANIEAKRAGNAGRTFGVVANEMQVISHEITTLASSLQGELRNELSTLNHHAMVAGNELQQVRGERLADLAHNSVEVIDRNLYERSCDVRWWATDQAIVASAADPKSVDKQRFASHRLGVILQSYTVYVDLWIADLDGNIISNGRPHQFPHVCGDNVANHEWFQKSLQTQSGHDFAVVDISTIKSLNHAVTAIYATAIRANGDEKGEIIGVLGIFFDWSAQAQSIVDGVRLTPEERSRSRCMLLDSNHRILASSDRQGILTETFPLDTRQGEQGYYLDHKKMIVGYALTPGYETYPGLGWYGVIMQTEN